MQHLHCRLPAWKLLLGSSACAFTFPSFLCWPSRCGPISEVPEESHRQSELPLWRRSQKAMKTEPPKVVPPMHPRGVTANFKRRFCLHKRRWGRGPLDVSTLLTDVQGSGSQNAPSAEALGGSGSALGAGSGSGSKGGKKKGQLTEVNFYDLQGSGNSFVFVIDRSDSMNEFSSAPLRAAKREVMKSLEGMKPTNFFQIIFYNDQPFPFQSKISGARSMIRSQDLEKRLAIDFVKNVNAFGARNTSQRSRWASPCNQTCSSS